MLQKHVGFHSSSSVLQEILSSGRDEEVTLRMIGATHRLRFHVPACASPSNADSCPASLQRLEEEVILPGLGPLTFDPKSF